MRMIDIIKPVYINKSHTEPLYKGWELTNWQDSRVGFQNKTYCDWAYSLGVFQMGPNTYKIAYHASTLNSSNYNFWYYRYTYRYYTTKDSRLRISLTSFTGSIGNLAIFQPAHTISTLYITNEKYPTRRPRKAPKTLGNIHQPSQACASRIVQRAC